MRKIDIQLEFVMEARVEVDPPLEIGRTFKGQQRIIPIKGGTFAGPLLNGVILPGGADWQVIRSDMVTEVEARYTLKTDDGVLISVFNKGYRHGPKEVIQKLAQGEPVDPKAYYFRTTPIFEVADERYSWLTRNIFVGVGERQPDKVILKFYQVK